MLYDLSNPLQNENFKLKSERLASRGEGIVELTEKKPPRTSSQNRYLHAVLGYTAVFFGETLDYVKENYFKKGCNRDLFVTYKDDERLGRKIAETRSSSSLDTGEMTTAIERYRNWCASQGCYVPSPDEHRMILLMEMEIERNKEFI